MSFLDFKKITFKINSSQEEKIKTSLLKFRNERFYEWDKRIDKSKKDFDKLINSSLLEDNFSFEIEDITSLINNIKKLSNLNRAFVMFTKALKEKKLDLTDFNRKIFNLYNSKDDEVNFIKNLIELKRLYSVGKALSSLIACYIDNNKYPHYTKQQWRVITEFFEIEDWQEEFNLPYEAEFLINLSNDEKQFLYKISILMHLREYIATLDKSTFDFFSLNKFLWFFYKSEINQKLLNEILEQWKVVLENYFEYDENEIFHFNILEDKTKHEKIREKVLKFIQDPNANEEMFIEFWNLLHSAMMGGSAKNIIKKNLDNKDQFDISKIKLTLKEMIESDEYDSKWESKAYIDGTQKTLWELYGVLNPDVPIINNCSKTALKYLLKKDIKDDYSKIRQEIENFKILYLKRMYFVPDSSRLKNTLATSIYMEIDKLFNIIDKVKKEDYENVKNQNIKNLYKLILKLKQEEITDGINYWIFQSNPNYYNLLSAIKELKYDNFQVNQHRTEIKEGDKVMFWLSGVDGGLVGYGDVMTNPRKFEDFENYTESDKYIISEEFRQISLDKNTLKVKVSYNPINKISKDQFRTLLEKTNIEPMEVSLFNRSGRGTNFKINKEIWELVINQNEIKFIDIDQEFSLFEGTEINPNEIIKVLEKNPQIILMGPPGTSKSYIAKLVAYKLTQNENNITFLQFHPSYSYEDFVEAREIRGGKSNQLLEFISTPKTFFEICSKANQPSNQNQNFVLILDEINRGNVEKIFGELIWALENRGKEIKLMYSKDSLIIPKNVFIIGTMNTIDLSISNIDNALLRRFMIFELMPSINFLKNWFKYIFKNKNSDFTNRIVKFMDDLNRKIIYEDENINEYQTIGHSYFMLINGNTIQEKWDFLKLTWRHSIRPLLLQYHNFNKAELINYERLYEYFEKEIELILVDINNE